MPSAGLATIRVSAGFGVVERSTTVCGSGAETLTPASRNEPLDFRLISRRKLKTTSAGQRRSVREDDARAQLEREQVARRSTP